MLRRTFLASAAAFAASPALAAEPRIALFDAAVYMSSPNTQRYPRGGAGSEAQGGMPRATNPATSTSTNRLVVPAEQLLQWMLELDIDRIAAVQNQTLYGFDNTYLLDSAEIYPAQISPVVIIDATRKDSAMFLRNIVASRGVAAIRLEGVMASDGSFPWIASDLALEIWQVAAETGIVLDLLYLPDTHSRAALRAIVALAEKFPSVRMSLDHMGWPRKEGAPAFGIDAEYAKVAQHKNIYFKFTSVNIDDLAGENVPVDQFLLRAAQILGADHLMWGSDLGADNEPYAQLVARGRAAATLLSPDDQQKVMHDTGRGFYIRGGLPTSLP